jgi:UDP-glucose:(heptosyl)LPS alpha-1,3-glucosyltransferase
MQLAFCLYKFFPFGGMQRDFLRIAQACQARGHAIRVYALEWQGDVPEGFEVVHVPVRAVLNHQRYRKYTDWVQADLTRRPADRVVGFNKMPGLDVYFAADPCFEEKARTLRNPFYRLGGRYRHFSGYERAVFAPESATEILLITKAQAPVFTRYYDTPAHRFHVMPPGIAADRRRPANAVELRVGLRTEFGIPDDELLVLQVGSGFRTKGVDRSLKALAALPEDLRGRTRLIVIGQDNPKPFQLHATTLGLGSRVIFLSGRSDVPRFLLGADLMLHPAYHEAGGIVLLEALVAGLPLIASRTCGFSHFIEEAKAGLILAEPFDQDTCNRALADSLRNPEQREEWQRNGLAFADIADLYSLAERAADIILRPRTAEAPSA